jgi:hypothetical protein
MAEEQRRLTDGQQRFEVQIDQMRGWFLEKRYRTHAPAYFGRVLRQVQPVHIGRLADALRERLAEGELAEVLLSDLILTGRRVKPSEAPPDARKAAADLQSVDSRYPHHREAVHRGG